MKQLRRPQQGKIIAGVALAFAEFFEIDVTIVRLVWAFLLIPGGLPGIVPYLICWIIIPKK